MHWAGENKVRKNFQIRRENIDGKRKTPKGKDMKEKEGERKKDTG